MRVCEPYKVKNEIEITEFFSAFVKHCTPEYTYTAEARNFWKFVYVLDGSVSIQANERIVNLNKNHIIFHKPMECHTLKTIGNTHPKLFIMSFSVSGKLIEKFNNKFFYLQPKQRTMLLSILEYMKENNEIDSKNITPLTYLQRIKDNTCYGQIIKNLTENFLMNLSDIDSSTRIVENNETIIYSSAINFIEENLCDKITISTLSKECNVSTAYLKKIFSKYTGLGIHEYILKSKILLAKQMLDSDSSVTSISHKLSFSSQNYFSFVFKRETGISPTEYKKKSFL